MFYDVRDGRKRGPRRGFPHRDQVDETRRILVVDDEDSLRLVLSRLLGSQGYEVLRAASPVDALAALADCGPIDLLVTDVRLPGISGLELAGRVRAQRPKTAVLAMSGHPRSFVEQSVHWKSGYGFLEKPFSGATLLAEVAATLSHSTTGPVRAEVGPTG